ncbi:MAG: hypothetical protein BGN97_01250 [Microbacterium sp. 69-10]|uniref:FUSC family protein n=1 Tax=Microbacterium sp. 69-10 TaxID=1895783 RepID=UPI000962BC1F|nr:FUSC family protein [Microbacterium sp. 69-10]OJU40632.1 MAG: hypothetical protein BGN97_01250 [Microbacterium sp. 69-10]
MNLARLFARAEAAWNVAFVAHLAPGFVLASAVLVPFAHPLVALVGGLCGALVMGLCGRVPGPLVGAVVLPGMLVALVCASLGILVAPLPLLAALVIALIVIASSLAAGASPLGAGLGLIATFAFAFSTSVRVLGGDPTGEVAQQLLVVVVGCAIGAVAGVVVGLVRARGRFVRPPKPEVSLGQGVMRSIRERDEHLHDGIRRALPIALAMLMFAALGGRDAYWAFLAALTILMPTGKPPMRVMLTRVVGTVVGVIVVSILSLFLPPLVLAVIAVCALLVGLAGQERYPVVGAALGAFGAIMLIGLPSGAVATWAVHRMLDTLIGSALALVAWRVLWPRDRATEPAE